MIVLDTSAVIALLGAEPEAPALEVALAGDRNRRVSAATLVEATQVATRLSDATATVGLDALLAALQVEIVAFDTAQLAAAREAFMKYGKGRGHPAQLNLGDCFAYALAKTQNAPLLFKGDDFSKTDIVAAA